MKYTEFWESSWYKFNVHSQGGISCPPLQDIDDR